MDRRFNLVDRLIIGLDNAQRSLTVERPAARTSPSETVEDHTLSDSEARESGALMRVNHAGEVAAQALYHGQSLFARNDDLRDRLAEAAREEEDHLARCRDRLHELDAKPSKLNLAWYTGGFAIGAIASAFGDKTSLGFVAETERQVVDHLKDHLRRLPASDAKSAAIIEQMAADEARHGQTATTLGGLGLPLAARQIMRVGGAIIRNIAYRV